MRKYRLFITIFIILFFCFSCTNPKDPEKVLSRAREHARQGNYEKALKDHVWFHDNALKYKPSLYGVRLSFALLDWVKLGEKYPDALVKLKKIRDQKTKQIIGGAGSQELFHDVKSINKYLKENHNTVELLKEMTEYDFKLAKRCYNLAKDDLIAAREYDLCNLLMNVPMFVVRDMRIVLDKNIEFYKTNQWADEAHLEWAVKHYLEEAESTLVVLVKNNRFIEAKRFLTEASKGIDIVRIKDGIVDLENKYLSN